MSGPDSQPKAPAETVVAAAQPAVTVTQPAQVTQPTGKPRRKNRWLLPALIVGSLGLTAFALLRPHGPSALPVSVVAAQSGTLVKTVSGTGSAKAEVSRTVSFPGASTANVISVAVKVGDEVRAGQELARLDTANAQRDLDAARASLQSARADLSRAEASARDSTLDQRRQLQNAQTAADSARSALQSADLTLRQQQQLLAVGAVSQQAVQTAQQARDDAARKLAGAENDLAYARSKSSESGQASILQSRAALETAQVRVQNLEKAMQDAVLISPTGGVVSAVNIAVGNPAATTQSAIEITDPARLYLEVPFDETRAASLAAGQSATIQFDAVPTRTFNGTVSRVDPVARTSGQVASVNARIRLDEASGVKPGFTGTATVTTRRLKNAVLVPLEATAETEGGKIQVWKVTPTSTGSGRQLGTASPVNVTITERNVNSAAVEGVKAGDLLVTPAPAPDAYPSGQQVSFATPDKNEKAVPGDVKQP